MDLDDYLAILRIASVVASSGLAIASLASDFRDRETRGLTTGGKLILLLVLLSLLVGIGAAVLESSKVRKDAVEQSARTEAILRELNRSMQPITMVEMTYWITVPQTDPLVKRYTERLKRELAARAADLAIFPPKKMDSTKGLSISSTDSDGNASDVEIEPSSDLWPSGEEQFIGVTTQFAALSINILKKPVDAQKFEHVSGNADFESWSILPERASLQWNMETSELKIFARTSDKKGISKRSGRITSILDLAGSQIMFFLPGSLDAKLPERFAAIENKNLSIFRKSLNLETVALTLSEGREIWLDKSQLQKSKFANGYPVFSATLPDPLE